MGVQGLEELHEGHRKEFYGAFGVDDKAAAKFDKQHPPPEEPSEDEEGGDEEKPEQPASKKQKRQPGAIGKENHKASGSGPTPASPPVGPLNMRPWKYYQCIAHVSSQPTPWEALSE